MELSVTITNVKNQPPQWEKESYTVVIPENTVRDTPVVVHLTKENRISIFHSALFSSCYAEQHYLTAITTCFDITTL